MRRAFRKVATWATTARLRPYAALVFAVASLVSGCAVGPDFAPPSAPQASGYSEKPLPSKTVSAKDAAGAAQHFVAKRDLPGDWWRIFGYAPLSALVERALKRNPDLRAAQSALRVAEANTAAAQGAFFPQVDGGLSAGRQKTGLGSTTGLASDTPTYNLFTGQVQVSYTPDVFGGTRRLVESLQAHADVERFQLEATYLTLTSHIVLAAIQEASLRGRIAATHKLIKIAKDLLHGLQAQFDAGAINELDIVTQQATLAQIEKACRRLNSNWRSSVTCSRLSRAVFRARGCRRSSNCEICACHEICR